MATPIVMPKQGQSVETCVITGWKKNVGDTVALGEVLCEVETDKAAFEVESPAEGTVLAIFRDAGDDVPVLSTIAVVGSPGEETESFRPRGNAGGEPVRRETPIHAGPEAPTAAAGAAPRSGRITASPRARVLAAARGLRLEGIRGTGPGGRIIERDVQSVLASGAQRMGGAGAQAPAGSIGGARIAATGGSRDLPVTGVRKLIAERMRDSLRNTAQLTLNAWADARALLEYRARLKEKPMSSGGRTATINDMILFCVSRALASHKDLNAHFGPTAIRQYDDVHLGFAVDTPRGLMVPVIKNTQSLGLSEIAAVTSRLANACQAGNVNPDDLAGGTFTVTNLGALGIESFTPVLNAPQVGILGVGCVSLRPRPEDSQSFSFIPQICLSLTIDHQAVDGAAGARFLKTLGAAMADFARIVTE
jgi:pyruvate dehydrogenase E2 component (dihydrolipoamide acetyltransferase)